GPSGQQRVEQPGRGRLADRDAAGDAQDVRHGPLGPPEELAQHAAALLGSGEMEVEEPRQRQVDVGDFGQIDGVVHAAELFQLVRGESQGRVLAERAPLLPAQFNVAVVHLGRVTTWCASPIGRGTHRLWMKSGDSRSAGRGTSAPSPSGGVRTVAASSPERPCWRPGRSPGWPARARTAASGRSRATGRAEATAGCGRCATWPTARSAYTYPKASATARSARQASGCPAAASYRAATRSEEHTSELQSRENLVCRPLLEKKKNTERS